MNCDNQSKRNMNSKLSEDVQKCILEGLKEFKKGVGLKRFSKILYGKSTLSECSKSKKCYGSLKKYSETDIQSFLKELISKKVLSVSKYMGNDMIKLNNGEEKASQDFTTEPVTIDISDEDESVKKVFKLLQAHKNVFITGHAGTGKSYILSRLKTILPDIVVTSTTGIAAVNVNGQTIHSWTGIGICNKSVESTVRRINANSTVKNRILDCKMLAIDEISMLDAKVFEYIDSVLKQVRQSDLPFGGIQVIFIGDFYQLPPVENESLIKGYCFESPTWNELNLNIIVLTKNYRQNEENLIKALSDIRINAMTPEDEQLLRTRECDCSEDLSDILHIFGTNDEANNYNRLNFDKIDSTEYTFNAIDVFKRSSNFNIEKICRVEKQIKLKVGARVMLMTNLDFDKGLINGSCGNIAEINKNYILVKFDNGETSEIKRHEFTFHRNKTLIAKRIQFPLRLAYGITIHKSQGMTLDKLVVDGNNIFAEGQIYVALSRIKTLDGLYLVNFNPEKIKVNEKVAGFYKELKETTF